MIKADALNQQEGSKKDANFKQIETTVQAYVKQAAHIA